ncbi:hypothetical protein Tco_1445866 [Tanacetum coccineum]
MATSHPVIGATWPVNSSSTGAGATDQRRSTVAVNGGQRQSTAADHREPPSDLHRTTVGPPVNDRSMVGSGCHVACHVDPLTYICSLYLADSDGERQPSDVEVRAAV